MEFEPPINYNCDVINNSDGSLTLTGKEDQNTFSSNGVTITLEKDASITVHSISRKPEPFTIYISDNNFTTKAMIHRLMDQMAEEILVVLDNPCLETLRISDKIDHLRLAQDNINALLNRSFEPADKPKKLDASTFQHRKGAFANGGRG